MENYTFRGTRKNGGKTLRNKDYSIGKGNIILENVHLRKGAGHNREPTENSYYWGSGLPMTTTLKSCLGAMP